MGPLVTYNTNYIVFIKTSVWFIANFSVTIQPLHPLDWCLNVYQTETATPFIKCRVIQAVFIINRLKLLSAKVLIDVFTTGAFILDLPG